MLPCWGDTYFLSIFYVKEEAVQSSERNLYGRSVRLDALCTLGDGTKCNIEVQRSDNDDHFRRVRFNASSITVRSSEPGEKFKEVVELYMVYISEFDILGAGMTTYHVEKTARETGQAINDGVHEIYVNTEVNDGTTIAELMECFKQKNMSNDKFPVIMKAFNKLKKTKGGTNKVCKVMDKYIMETIIEDGIAFGATENAIINQMIQKLDMTKEEASVAYDAYIKNHVA